MKEKKLKNKIRQAETRVILRSQINLAPYNPRIISEEARGLLKGNIKRLGLMGGVVWNENTGNLVSGHQRVGIMDEANGYDKGNDYELKVEVANLTEKEEKEQNLFFNNKSAQGDFDRDMLRDMLSDIDYSFAGLTEFEVSTLYDTTADLDFSPDKYEINEAKQSEKTEKVKRDKNFYEDSEENQEARHNAVRAIKDRISKKSDIENDGGMLSYLVISFESVKNKISFCYRFGLNAGEKYINGEEFSKVIERID